MAHTPDRIKRVKVEGFTVALSAQNRRADQVVQLPESFNIKLNKRLKEHDINSHFLVELPKGYSELKSVKRRAELIPHPNRITIDFKTEYFSQIAGRFRWVVHVTVLLQEAEQSKIETFSIPVFHKYGHQKDVASIERALPQVLDQISIMINEHLKESQK